MASTQQLLLGEGAGGAEKNYIEDVFSTYLYTGTYTGGSETQTINNGIDLSTKGGMTWIKVRNDTYGHVVVDSARGTNNYLRTNTTDAQLSDSTQVQSFNSNGFTVGPSTNTNYKNEASWTFRKQPKFFDVVTYTGNNSSQTISHNLGSTPGCIIVKCVTGADGWFVYHSSLGASKYLRLDLVDIANTSSGFWGSVTSTSFGTTAALNASGQTYVAYLFASDAGGFGLTGTDNVISCGSYTGAGTTEVNVNLGFEPQWLLIKNTTGTSDWTQIDTMRGMTVGLGVNRIRPNQTFGEGVTSDASAKPTATGFSVGGTAAYNWLTESGKTFIYIAIRRGPMKVPTDGTKVFAPVAYTGTNVDNRLVDTGIVTDMTMARIRSTTSSGGFYTADRLRADAFLGTAATAAEATDADSFMTPTVGYGSSFSAMNGFGVGNDVTRQLNQSSTSQLAYAFKRAPSFFDEVCYTGNDVDGQVRSHNLTVKPELVILKTRNSVQSWPTLYDFTGAGGAPNGRVYLNLTDANSGSGLITAATASSITLAAGFNSTPNTYVAYLFATCAGVSKVGSYTGTGTTQQINCGFAAGARFVLIKRTDSTGDWYVWDTARGIVAGNDPYLLLNSTAAEVTSTDYIDTYSAGFEISSTAPAAINASGGTFIFLAIA